MKKIYTCIVCPNGCEIETEFEGRKIINVSGNLCPKGIDYVTQEITNPKRTIASSIVVDGGELPVTSVRLTSSIDKKMIFSVMEEIKKIHVKAPVYQNTIVCRNICETGSDLLVTKTVNKL